MEKQYTDFVGEEPNGHPYEVYHADEVDATLAERNRKIAELEGLLRDIADQGPSDLLGDALVARIHRALMESVTK